MLSQLRAVQLTLTVNSMKSAVKAVEKNDASLESITSTHHNPRYDSDWFTHGLLNYDWLNRGMLDSDWLTCDMSLISFTNRWYIKFRSIRFRTIKHRVFLRRNGRLCLSTTDIQLKLSVESFLNQSR